MSFDWKPTQNPAEEAEVIKMAKSIQGLREPIVMKMRLTEIYGHRRAMGWMGAEAIKREGIRVSLFDKEKANV